MGNLFSKKLIEYEISNVDFIIVNKNKFYYTFYPKYIGSGQIKFLYFDDDIKDICYEILTRIHYCVTEKKVKIGVYDDTIYSINDDIEESRIHISQKTYPTSTGHILY